MSAFTHRTAGYKFGVAALFFITIVCLVGFGSPYWSSSELFQTGFFGSSYKMTYHEGIWMLCSTTDIQGISSTTSCSNYGVSGLPAWFHVVRALLSLCSTGLIIACIYALATNCCRSVPGPRSRLLEVLGILAGVLGFTGCMVYVGMRSKEHDGDSSVQGDLSDILEYIFGNLDWTFSWAFYLASVGSGLSVVICVIIAVCNKEVDVPAHTGGMVMTTVTAQPGYAPQPYGGYPGYAPTQPGYPPQAGYAPPPPQGGYGGPPAKAGYPA